MSKGNLQFALDATARYKDADGRLHVSRSHISKATVNPYYGREIPGHERLGLDPNKIYRLLRHPEELARGAQTFARLQILGKHIAVSADDPKKEHIIGSIGSNVEFNEPYLDADLCFWDEQYIALIELGEVRELSCSYRYVAVMTPGTYQGMEYDGVMTEIVGNHLALVEAGRAGSDVLVADEDTITMSMTKLGKALYLTLGGMSPKLAADSALSGLVAKASKKTTTETLVPKLIAMDSELDEAKLKKTLSALFALDAEEKAEDEDDDEDDTADDEDEDDDKEKSKAAKDRRAKDEEAKKAEDKKAMDSAIAASEQRIRAELRDADEARRLVRPAVGDVVAQDSAEQIYLFALDQMQVPHEGVTGVPALRALFNASQRSAAASTKAAPAMDSAATVTMFPDASRFRRM